MPSDGDPEDGLDDVDVVADLPTVDVEFSIDVPGEIEEMARERFQRAKEHRDLPDTVTFEDYLMDHIELSWDFDLEGSDE